MARTDSIAVLLENSSHDKLAEIYGGVIENVQKNTISGQLKNTELSGTPRAGSYEAKRFTNTASKSYGTARGNHAGDKVVARPITIPVNVDKEIINEVEQKDVSLYGVADMVSRKAASNQKTMARDLEHAFFAEAVTAGTSHSFTAVTIEAKAEELIQLVETVQNAFVDGVERDEIALVLKPALYGQLRTYFDKVEQGNATAEGVGYYHGVRVFSTIYMPSGIDAIVMREASIAQPVEPDIYGPKQIELSEAIGFGLFYHYGTKAVTPDLIFYVGSPSSSGIQGA
ncbi:MAG: hypothetical protein IKP01_02180 [Bacteroidales bacterium]|nr:hypothetical protein [Bacteroidales bacterium]